MPNQRVFVDANVLVSRCLRDWLLLLRLNTDGMFQVHTTEDVLAEAVSTLRNLKADMPGGTMTAIIKRIRDALDEVVEDFDTSIPYSGKDPDDLHVHAAAVACGADILLTQDTGFTQDDTTPYELFRCDDFFILIDDSAPWLVSATVKQMNGYWQAKPAAERKGLAGSMRAAGCPEFAGRVEGHLRALSGHGPSRRH